MRGMQWQDLCDAADSSPGKSVRGSSVLWRERGVELDAHALLEVEHNASPQTIRKAYRALMEKFHPDRQPEHLRLWAEERAKQINAAYALLKDEVRRGAVPATCSSSPKHEDPL